MAEQLRGATAPTVPSRSPLNRENLKFCRRRTTTARGSTTAWGTTTTAPSCSPLNPKVSPLQDHHCPWLNNCVGHGNYRAFLQFLAYATAATCHALGPAVRARRVRAVGGNRQPRRAHRHPVPGWVSISWDKVQGLVCAVGPLGVFRTGIESRVGAPCPRPARRDVGFVLCMTTLAKERATHLSSRPMIACLASSSWQPLLACLAAAVATSYAAHAHVRLWSHPCSLCRGQGPLFQEVRSLDRRWCWRRARLCHVVPLLCFLL